jgi:hypothetical protein
MAIHAYWALADSRITPPPEVRSQRSEVRGQRGAAAVFADF